MKTNQSETNEMKSKKGWRPSKNHAQSKNEKSRFVFSVDFVEKANFIVCLVRENKVQIEMNDAYRIPTYFPDLVNAK